VWLSKHDSLVILIRYFQRLADEFEVQMQQYRQQIVELEDHLESADRAASFTPQGLTLARCEQTFS
jgi:hypothetical protein